MIERGDKGLSAREGIDQDPVPIAAANKVALCGCEQAGRPTDLGSGLGEGFGIAKIGGLTGAILAKFWVPFFVLGFHPKLQQIDLRDGPIMRVIAKGAKLINTRSNMNQFLRWI